MPRAAPTAAPVCPIPAPATPSTRRDVLVDTRFGAEVSDPYRWLEGDARGEGPVRAWIAQQAAATDGYLERLPARDAFARSLATLYASERFGLCSQIRRASVSVARNIVEGCARRTTRDYLHFINIATGSAAEALYLLDVSSRLGFLRPEVYRDFDPKYSLLLRGLQSLTNSLEGKP